MRVTHVVTAIIVAATAATVGITAGTHLAGQGEQGGTPGLGVPSALTANLFVVASGGTPSCVRQSTARTYAVAVASFPSMICGPGNGITGYLTTGLDNSCKAATGGDVVRINQGVYSKNADGTIMKYGDCSDGLGANVNPNCVEQGVSCAATRANWVTYRCTDSPCGNINWPAANMLFAFAKFHAQFIDVPFNRGGGVQLGSGGESLAQQTGELAFIGSSTASKADFYGIQVIGAKDVLFQHINYGPSNQCAANDANAAVAFRCDPAADYFESQWANVGVNSVGCTPNLTTSCAGFFGSSKGWAENYVHDASAFGYENVRYEDFVDHDGQGKQDGSGVHPGCLNTFGGNTITTASNLVFDHAVCERVNAQGFANQDSGVTIQNSVFNCTVASLQNTTGKWDQCGSFSAVGISCSTGSSCTESNVLVRFNTFNVPSGGGTALDTRDSTVGNPGFGPHSNVRVIGNLFIKTAPSCNGAAGITFANNAFGNGLSTCGTGTVTLAAGDPLTDSDVTTPGDLYLLTGTSIDATLDGSPSVATFDASALGSDYVLALDAAGNSRTLATMRYGAYN